MKSRMTIVEALDERDLLIKKIMGKIGKLEPVALISDREAPERGVLCTGRVRAAADNGYDRTV